MIKQSLKILKAVVFDFDGVLVESVDIKTKAFCSLFEKYPEHLEEITQYHLDHGGISREEKIRHFYKQILRKPLLEDQFKELCGRYHELVADQVVEAPFVEGAHELLKRCSRKYQTYVVSGTPEAEIVEIVKRRKMEKYFNGVFGSPKAKAKILQDIMNRDGFKPHEVLFIGDSRDDFHAANALGIRFIARVVNKSSDWLRHSSILAQVDDLKEVGALLAGLNRRVALEKK